MLCLEKLKDRLREGGVPIETWGLPGTATKTVEHLFAEIKEGSASISPEGPVSCHRTSVCIDITHFCVLELTVRRLVETRQVFPDGSPRMRNLPYLRETAQLMEDLRVTACRGLQEELGIDAELEEIINPNVISIVNAELPRQYVTKHYTSDVYPGLSTWRTEWHVSYAMPQRHYRPEGYTLLEHGITTHFEWLIERTHEEWQRLGLRKPLNEQPPVRQ
ncbi:MAG TPA: hypothetical protein VEB18_02835 [Candidatus Paceibacterota bacterium]|nr:hypothetical protein [Candidatus Paceibacterota bacterium]